MTAWDEALESTREQFVDALEQRGFTYYPPDELSGTLPIGDGERITVRLGNLFPFAPPAVYPSEEFPRSWHRELDGAMCLYPQAGREALPWLATESFTQLIARWFEQSSLGWPDDAPDLDLDRYFYSADDDRLVLYEGIEALLGNYIRLSRGPATMTVIGTGSAPAKRLSSPKRAFGYTADIGEPAIPPHNWASLLELIDPAVASTLDRAVRERRINYLLVAYQRQGQRAVLALETHDTVDGIELRSMASASADSSTLRIRSGSQAAAISNSRVLILGVGSIGSFLADALQRAGVGELEFRDRDIVRPGNLVRHLAGPAHYGQPKALAVRQILLARPFNATKVIADPTNLSDPAEVPALLERFDLVIDATADSAVTPMINTAARTFGQTVLNVCVQDEGRVVRVDVVPPPPGTTAIPGTVVTPEDDAQLVFEAGCGDPVSLTPPFAVAEAAQLCARFAVALLLQQPLTTSGATRDYRPAS